MSERFSERMRRERADLIIAEAIKLLAEQGCCRLRVEDVARRAGVAKGTIYLDFQSKEELVEASLRRCGEEVVESLDEQVRETNDPRERVVRAIEFIARLPADRPDISVLLDHRVLCDFAPAEKGESRPAFDAMPSTQIEKYLTTLIQRAQAARAVRQSIDPEVAAQATLAVAQVPGWQRFEDGPKRVVQTVSAALFDNVPAHSASAPA